MQGWQQQEVAEQDRSKGCFDTLGSNWDPCMVAEQELYLFTLPAIVCETGVSSLDPAGYLTSD